MLASVAAPTDPVPTVGGDPADADGGADDTSADPYGGDGSDLAPVAVPMLCGAGCTPLLPLTLLGLALMREKRGQAI